MTSFAIVHRISIPAPATHLVHVETRISSAMPLPDAVVLFMATWTPGSYLIREYARHVEGLTVERPATVAKVRKNGWLVEPGGAGQIVVRYRVYAGELTVRTSHVNDTHAFLVGAALFLGVEGHEGSGARVEIEMPVGWRAATALTRAAGENPAVHTFEAPSFDALVDSPIELGTHREEGFHALGKAHRMAFCPSSAIADEDARRLVADTKTIVETEAKLFGGTLPYDGYDILLHWSSRGRGGLEHRDGAALIAPKASFATREGYLDLLSLVAHEIFHAWNIKRIRPAGLSPYRYGHECYTRLLWWFEGATSYYDWRTLALAGLCTVDEYLDHLAAEIAYLDQTPGRLVHSLEEASYDAWIKLYRPDENSANSSVSYYRKGEVVCAMLDLELFARTGGRVTLDRVLLHLWQAYGQSEREIPENGMQSIFEQVATVPLADIFDGWIRGLSEIPYESALAHVGLTTERTTRAEAAPCSTGLRLRAEGGRTFVNSAIRDSTAWRAGLDPGDEIVAIDDVRVEGTAIDAALRGRVAGQAVEVTFAREGRTAVRSLVLEPARLDRLKIMAHPQATARAREAFAAWLGQGHPAWAKGPR
jgi:predicted metalloprotease with PDZ domain